MTTHTNPSLKTLALAATTATAIWTGACGQEGDFADAADGELDTVESTEESALSSGGGGPFNAPGSGLIFIDSLQGQLASAANRWALNPPDAQEEHDFLSDAVSDAMKDEASALGRVQIAC